MSINKLPPVKKGRDFTLEWIENIDEYVESNGFIACKDIDFTRAIKEAQLSHNDLYGPREVQKEALHKLKKHLILNGYMVVCPEHVDRLH